MIALSRLIDGCCVSSKDQGLLGDVFVYQVAGNLMLSSEPVEALSSFETNLKASERIYGGGLVDLKAFVLLDDTNAHLQYRGLAQFDRRLRMTSVWCRDREGENLIQIDVEGRPVCLVDLNGRHIFVLNDEPFDATLNLEVITGPALISLLADVGVYCLHAGAVRLRLAEFECNEPCYANVAFIAESGVGKSTLSRHSGPDWCQLSDDILPIEIADEVRLFNDFPQLKLPNSKPVNVSLSESLVLDFIIVLDEENASEFKIERLSSAKALIMLIRHTVASRAFNHQKMIEQMAVMREVVERVPVFSVAYPRVLSELPDLRKVIADRLVSVKSL